MTAHYTGTNVDYTDKVTPAVVRQIQQIFSKTKPFEYNYVIGQEDNDEIYEFAGTFQAAHSAGENPDAFGVLFLLGVGEPLLPHMIEKWKWLRDVLLYVGALRQDVIQLPHYLMPGASTACPGQEVMKNWHLLLAPYVNPEPPVITGPLPKVSTKPVPEFRLFDSRVNNGKPLPVGIKKFTLDNRVPATAKGLHITLTVADPVDEGYLTVWNGQGGKPNTSKLNYKPNTAPICNSTYTEIANRSFSVYTDAKTHLIIDVFGYD